MIESEFIIYNDVENVISGKSKHKHGCSIAMSRIHGKIRFSFDLVEMLTLKDGSGFEFIQRKKAPEEWYLSLNEKEGLKLKFDSKGYFGINNKLLIEKILSECKIQENNVRFIVSKEPIEGNGKKLYPIITRNIKSNKI